MFVNIMSEFASFFTNVNVFSYENPDTVIAILRISLTSCRIYIIIFTSQHRYEVFC